MADLRAEMMGGGFSKRDKENLADSKGRYAEVYAMDSGVYRDGFGAAESAKCDAAELSYFQLRPTSKNRSNVEFPFEAFFIDLWWTLIFYVCLFLCDFERIFNVP